MRLRTALAAAMMLFATSAAAQVQIPRLPDVRAQQPHVPAPLGPSGEGLYVGGADRVNLRAGDTVIASLPLPRGSYQVIARAVIANDRASDGAANCSLRSGGGELDYVSITLPPMSRREFMLMGVARLDAAVRLPVNLVCQATPEIAATARWARIHALAVPQVSGSAPAEH